MNLSEYSFLAVPLKSTNEVDLIKPLTTYIDSVYNTSDDDKAEISEAVQELNKLRSKSCCQPLDKHQSALDILTRYYDQLVAIENKIIISANQNPVVFKWKDAFDKGSLFSSRASLSLSDGSFERAAVLFNCGALMSQIAATQTLLTDDDIKSATKLFQQASGIFALLRDTILSLVSSDATPDLCSDTLGALSAIALAQAQECIYIKANRDKMKSSALVKITAQVHDFYGDAQKLMNKDSVKGLFEKEWHVIVSYKSMAFDAISQYFQSEVNNENKDFGEQLSRLTEALRIAELSGKFLSSSYIDSQYSHIRKAFAAAKKDNDFIYHARIPEFKNLASLPRAVLVKALPVTHPIYPRFKDMFAALVPVQVHNAMQSYEARKGDIVNMETARMRESTQLLNGVLASLNLPAALDDVTSTMQIPESIKLKSSKVKQLGGIEALRKLLSDLPALYKRNEEILEETNKMLSEERQSDDTLRSQFGAKWTRMSSEELTKPLVQEVGKYRAILNTASSADKMVRNKLEANEQGIETLSKNETELRAAIPGQHSHASGAVTSESVNNLKRLMKQIDELKNERETLEKELKAVKCDVASDFLKALADSQLLNEESISKEKIQQFYGPLRQRVDASLQKQEQILAEVQANNTSFVGEKAGSPGGADRERILKMLATAHDVFLELKSNLEEGTKFYNDLTPILVRLQSKISDFSFARQTEKQDLMRQLQQNIVSGTASSGSASAPPRPPPPRQEPTPVPPPRTQSNDAQVNNQAPFPMAPQQFQPPYYQQAVPYGQPQPMFYAPTYQPNMANPYPTYPGAFAGNYQQQPFGQTPYGPPFAQQPPPGTNPFAQNFPPNQ